MTFGQQPMDLCGIWRFQPDPFHEGETRQYFQPSFDVRMWREVRVPCTFDQCMVDLAAYEEARWFRTTFTAPGAWQGRHVALRCEGINYHARVWLNGVEIGRNMDGFLRFEVPVHDQLLVEAENVLVIRVDNVRKKGEVPGMERGWRPYGGILREVVIEVRDSLHLAHLAVTATPDAQDHGVASFNMEVVNLRDAVSSPQLAITITDTAGTELHSMTIAGQDISPGAVAEMRCACEVRGITPWSPQHPTLYLVHVAVLVTGETVDAQTYRFGFREVEIKAGQLLLNGEPIFLTGFNRHEDSSRAQMCSDLALVKRDLEQMKAMGCNYIRRCHYPHHPGELDLCDELGLLVMSVTPRLLVERLRGGRIELSHEAGNGDAAIEDDDPA